MKSIAVLATCLLLAACERQAPPGPPPPTITPAGGSSQSPGAEASAKPTAAPAQVQEFPVPAGSGPHDVAPARDGGVWYTAQRTGELGYLDPGTGRSEHVPLGRGSAPHGVIVGPDGAAWVTDSGLNAIVRVDASSRRVRTFALPNRTDANLNTATFDSEGTLWFTGQSGVYGRLDPSSGKLETYEAPKGRGPYGTATDPKGVVWYSSLAGSYIARIDSLSGRAETFDVPSEGGGARRVWSDSSGNQWVTEWNAGKLARFNPETKQWREFDLPGDDPQPYAVFVDDRDIVWVSDFGANALLSFDPRTEKFTQYPHSSPGANVRQILGRRGEVWGAQSGSDRLQVIRTA